MECELVAGLEYTYVELANEDMFVKESVAVATKPGLSRHVDLSIASLLMWQLL